MSVYNTYILMNIKNYEVKHALKSIKFQQGFALILSLKSIKYF